MKRLLLLAAVTSVIASAAPALAETVNCTNITSLPATITVPGVYCLKQDLATSITSGAAITINANSVTIDFNGYRLGGLGAGPATGASGVYAVNRKNITLRNGSVRGFIVGISLDATGDGSLSSGHVVEDNLVEASTTVGIRLVGTGLAVRRNRIVNTDSTPPAGPSLQTTSIASPVLRQGAGRIATASNGPVQQAGTGTQVNGIYALGVRNSQIVDNFIAETVSSGDQAFAILVTQSSNLEISRNTIVGVRGNTFTVGVANNSGSQPAHTISDNTILDVSGVGAVYGILNFAGSLICRNNVVGATATQTAGCTAESGTFPPPGP